MSSLPRTPPVARKTRTQPPRDSKTGQFAKTKSTATSTTIDRTAPTTSAAASKQTKDMARTASVDPLSDFDEDLEDMTTQSRAESVRDETEVQPEPTAIYTSINKLNRDRIELWNELVEKNPAQNDQGDVPARRYNALLAQIKRYHKHVNNMADYCKQLEIKYVDLKRKNPSEVTERMDAVETKVDDMRDVMDSHTNLLGQLLDAINHANQEGSAGDQLINEIANEVKKITQATNTRQTYADIAGKSTKLNKINTNANKQTKPRINPVILKPLHDSNEAKNIRDYKSDITRYGELTRNAIGVATVRMHARGNVFVGLQKPEDKTKFIEQYNNNEDFQQNYQLIEERKRNPRMVIHDVRIIKDDDRFLQTIYAQNPEFESQGGYAQFEDFAKDIKIILHLTNKRRPQYESYVIEVTPHLRKTFKKLTKIRFECELLSHGDKILITRCTKCCQYGHRDGRRNPDKTLAPGTECRNERVCTHCCSTEHLRRDCPHKNDETKAKCPACFAANNRARVKWEADTRPDKRPYKDPFDHDHSLLDPKCKSYERYCDGIRDQTQYE